ncbi:hypothetical protein PENARI_c105G04832 [Penicillium arizonense]|uniref:Uncharacterized protein n=1 Tax=Penicillium arizonense TaxID=1835702 RepID=A0A1F5L0F5_PENAI|nr:hypothetical protein PENARI_c288G09523 [Penicillium arizonense]XP_022482279.1 hypothetical protein PENARI_c105G04832 [Penicillium arizonense]OGE46411.1 hypothetical protein PENARI_c288G09523 [Penicillium arizonense]OGE46812.1 hypothetical protein PENARI_c105G04832 [Penicillium arizonense]
MPWQSSPLVAESLCGIYLLSSRMVSVCSTTKQRQKSKSHCGLLVCSSFGPLLFRRSRFSFQPNHCYNLDTHQPSP